MTKNNKIVILGDGLLGSELHKQTNWDFLSRKKDNIEFTEPVSYWWRLASLGCKTVVNCIAHTDTYSDDFEKHWDINYIALIKLVNHCNNMNYKLVHISTDYIYAGSEEDASESDVPVHARNWYSYTKLIGDAYIQAASKNFLLIRTSFKPNPFPYPKAITTQTGNFDYVDRIAYLIIELIKKNACGVFNVGTNKKSIYELAMRTRDVISSDDVIHPTMPTNITMNTEKMRTYLDEN